MTSPGGGQLTRAGDFSPARYDAMCAAIAACERVDEIAECKNRAVALEHYAKQAKNRDAERMAAKIRVRAERRCGELTREIARESGTHHPSTFSQNAKSSVTALAATLEAAGITRQQAHDYERLAAVPDEDFERELANPDVKPSARGISRRHSDKGKVVHIPVTHRLDEIRELAGKGHLAEQIGAALGVSAHYIRQQAKRAGIKLPGKSRETFVRSERVIASTVEHIDALAATINATQISFDGIAPSRAAELHQICGEALKVLRRFHSRLRSAAK